MDMETRIAGLAQLARGRTSLRVDARVERALLELSLPKLSKLVAKTGHPQREPAEPEAAE